LSNPENTKETPLSEEQSAEEDKESSLSEKKAIEEVREAPKAPEPTATGDDKITILKHGIYIKSKKPGEIEKAGVELVIKNVSDVTIGSALFEAVFYDRQGNILDRVEQKMVELRHNITHSIRITSSSPERDKIESYDVRLVKTTMTPKPIATGNEKITILKHHLSEMAMDFRGGGSTSSAELAIRNVSDSTIATAVFEALFYDIEGNTVDTVKRREIDLKPSTSRAIIINSSIRDPHKVKSYNIRVIRMTTTDFEKVQLRGHMIRTTEAGEEEVRGTVKNISDVKTDTALVATFYNPKKENIGTKVLILRDIEPDSIRQFHFKFKPQEGDIVRTYTLNIGEIADGDW